MIDKEHPLLSSGPDSAKGIAGISLFVGALLIGSLLVPTLLRNALWREPLALWQDVVRKSPERPRGYYNLGLLYGKREQIGPAIDAFTRALALAPGYADAHNNLGIEYAQLGLYDEALSEFNAAIPLYHDPRAAARAYYNRGRVFLERKLLDQALADLTTAVSLDPGYADAAADRNLVLTRLGQNVRPGKD